MPWELVILYLPLLQAFRFVDSDRRSAIQPAANVANDVSWRHGEDAGRFVDFVFRLFAPRWQMRSLQDTTRSNLRKISMEERCVTRRSGNTTKTFVHRSGKMWRPDLQGAEEPKKPIDDISEILGSLRCDVTGGRPPEVLRDGRERRRYKLKEKIPESPETMENHRGKVCIVTGANSGIGFAVASRMAEHGYKVHLACRSAENGNNAVARIRHRQQDADVSFMPLDLASIESIQSFVQAFRSTGDKLNVLINNAGIGLDWSLTVAPLTRDGFELTFGVNHLGHFLLTNLLLDELKAAAQSDGEARVVVVSSQVHDPEFRGARGRGLAVHIDFEDLQLIEKPGVYSGEIAYKNSKLANVLFAYELNRRLQGSNVTCNAMNPGFVPTTSFFKNFSPFLRCCMLCCCLPFGRCFGMTRTVTQGADCVVLLATSEKLRGVGGKYFSDCQETQSSKESYDPEVAERLWTESAKLLKMDEL